MRISSLLLALTVLASTGCAGYVAKRIVEPPNQSRAGGLATGADQANWREQIMPHLYSETWRVKDASGNIDIGAYYLPAGHYPHQYDLDMDYEQGRASLVANFSISPGVRGPAKGTMVLIHGWLTDSRSMLFHAFLLAEVGYDIVLLDLRGHGLSGGEHITWGVREADDLARVLALLHDEGVLQPPVVLMGQSLGGVVALLGAAHAGPLDAIVAVAPFADLETVLPGSLREVAPGWIKPMLSERRVDKASRLAEQRADFQMTAAAPLHVVGRLQIPLLLIYGEEDRIVPISEGERLHAASCCSTLVRVPGHRHATLIADRDTVTGIMLNWLAAAEDDRLSE